MKSSNKKTAILNSICYVFTTLVTTDEIHAVHVQYIVQFCHFIGKRFSPVSPIMIYLNKYAYDILTVLTDLFNSDVTSYVSKWL